MARVSALAICIHQAANNRAGHFLARTRLGLPLDCDSFLNGGLAMTANLDTANAISLDAELISDLGASLVLDLTAASFLNGTVNRHDISVHHGYAHCRPSCEKMSNHEKLLRGPPHASPDRQAPQHRGMSRLACGLASGFQTGERLLPSLW